MSFDCLNNKIICEDLKYIYKQGKGWDYLRNQKILVTGAYGMLPSYLVYFLIFLNEYYDYKIEIWTLTRREEPLKCRFGRYVEKEYFHNVQHGLDHEVEIETVMDYIVHAASLASPQYYLTQPVETILPNIMGTYWLLEYAKKYGVKKFLFFSSSEVYGKQNKELYENYNETVFGELNPAEVRNCYAESKRMGENLCADYAHEYGVATASVRIFHTFGPTMDIKNDERAFSEFVSCVVAEKNIEMKSDGTAKRPFCYISDAVCAFLLILQAETSGESYNLCNEDNYISIMELADLLVNLFPEKGLKVEKVERSDSSQYAIKRDENQVTASSKKLRNMGWSPNITVKEGFHRTICSIMEQNL